MSCLPRPAVVTRRQTHTCTLTTPPEPAGLPFKDNASGKNIQKRHYTYWGHRSDHGHLLLSEEGRTHCDLSFKAEAEAEAEA